MILRSLSTRKFRNLTDAEHEFHPRVNVFLGENGQGKSNLLEAIYFLSTTKSFRTARAANLVRLKAQSVYAEGRCDEERIERSLSVGIHAGDERKRQLLVNGQKTTLAEYLQVMPVFAYSSARLEIVRGGPDERRRFLDRGLASLRLGYLRDLTRYGRVLKQRNALLQRVSDGSEKRSSLDAWDEELVAAAGPIVAARRDYVAALTGVMKALLEEYAFTLDDLTLTYRPATIQESGEKSLADLRQLRSRELGAGFSLAGPHRDVLEITARGVPAAELLSSGEIKTLTLLLKFAKVQVYRDEVRRSPIFLLDDIDAELDLGVIQQLLSSLLASGQFFTSSAKESIFRLLEVGPHRRFQVRNGGVSEARNEER